MRIFLDDIHMPTDKYPLPEARDMAVIRTAKEVISLFLAGQVDYISFDHDLGGKLTGYDVAVVIERNANKIKPPAYDIHSANPVGWKNIQRAMESAHRIWYQNNQNL